MIEYIIPAAGKANRLNGIPKMLLPLNEDNFLLKNLINLVYKSGKLYITTNEENYLNLKSLFPNINIVKVTSDSMIETVMKTKTNTKSNKIMIMSDIYFEDKNILSKVSSQLKSDKYDIVLGLWKIREDQKGKLGQCKLSNDLVLEVIDKDINCNEQYFWGIIGWKPSFEDLLNVKQQHFGEAINLAIEKKYKVGYQVANGLYFDCGTFNEYRLLLEQTVS